MSIDVIKQIINEELKLAQERILDRLSKMELKEDSIGSLPPLPENEKYEIALRLYRLGASHSEVSRQLETPMNNVKRYYNWLVNNKYLPIEHQDLSEREKQVVECIFEKGMSLNETAKELGISTPNVVQRRDSALRKGYKPPTAKEGK
jgi:DNA invertase Pin-like site-specific DNA recombinase